MRLQAFVGTGYRRLTNATGNKPATGRKQGAVIRGENWGNLLKLKGDPKVALTEDEPKERKTDLALDEIKQLQEIWHKVGLLYLQFGRIVYPEKIPESLGGQRGKKRKDKINQIN